MAVTRERFDQGLTYDDYKNQMTRNRERLEDNERTLALSGEDAAFFANLPQTVHALALAEDWCGDVINNLPILGRLAQESGGKLDVRVFPRDQHLDLMDQYLNQGQHRSIPVFVFFDQDWRELGHWIERPAAVSERQGKAIGELFASDPAFEGIQPGASPAELPDAARDRLMQFYGQFRGEIRAFSDAEVVRELRELIAGKLG